MFCWLEQLIGPAEVSQLMKSNSFYCVCSYLACSHFLKLKDRCVCDVTIMCVHVFVYAYWCTKVVALVHHPCVSVHIMCMPHLFS
jgi:hypothetical protein